ncbi:MAG: sucrase ferredoxin [Cyanobacteria bacterium CRU_2_1]|nr:sucrase ferredoxin [Cyanobacteria bacterium RU_5_0]NJR63501.1 sucrase ferredoxin [Cyanobacteria bacterium CRU_2_1]
MTLISITDCRFCSLISKANGEDPIGSAPIADHWLIIELPQPWATQVFQADADIQPVFALMRKVVLQGVKLRPIAIAPDREYSQPGYRRILYYDRSHLSMSAFEPQEYLVPTAKLGEFATALLKQISGQPSHLERFELYRQANCSMRDILVCTHGNVDVACSRFGFPIYDKLRKAYANETLRVWRCSHFGGHQYAPTLVDLPSGRYWGHLELETLDTLVHQQGNPLDLYRFYRGWAGLAKFEQIAERELWMREGWDWLTYQKQGRVLKLGENGLLHWIRHLLRWIPSRRLNRLLERSKQDARWAIVQIDYAAPDGSVGGSYRARVEVSGQIQTAIRSAEQMTLVPVNQYRVTGLNKLVYP